MIRKFWLYMVVALLSNSLSGQDNRIPGRILMDTLKAGDLLFPVDSNRMRMISAGRISKRLEDLPLTIYVITHEEILRNQYTSLIDVLNSLPAIRTSQPGSGELGESFQIRGLTGNLYSKILINGLPIKPTVVSGMPIGSQLPIREAEKIEVIYGTSSAIYGADAVSGVINIITKEAERGTFVRGDIGLGRGGYNYINFFLGGKGGKNNNILQYSFYGSKAENQNIHIKDPGNEVYNPLNYYQQKGEIFNIGGNDYDPLDVTETLLRSNGIDPDDFILQYYGPNYSGSLVKPDIESFSTASHMLGVQMKFRGVSLSYNNMYRRTHSSIGLSPVFYRYDNPQNYWGETINRITLSYKKELGFFSSNTQMSNLIYQMDNNSNQGITFLQNTDRVYRYSASNDLLFEQVFSLSPIQNMELVAGLNYQRTGNLPVTNYLLSPFDKKYYRLFGKEVETRDSVLGSFGLNPITYDNLSGFIQFYYILNRFRFLGGLRYDRNTLYGNRTSPQFAVLYRRNPNTSFRISVGNAYKAPPSSITYQSLAYPVANDLVEYLVMPNPDLKPEKFTTFEFGFNTLLFKRITIDQTFYFYQINNHIVPETLPVSDFSIVNAANDSVRTWINNQSSISNVVGSQTTLRWDNLVKSIDLDAELSLSFLNRQDKLPDVAEIVKEYLTFMPKHTGTARVSFVPFNNLYVNIESHWMSKWLRLLIPFEGLYKDLFKDIDGYYAMNTMVSYTVGENLRAYMKVTNLFDEIYGGVNATILEENLVYNPQIRRTIQFGLSYNLN